jgi:hypothetical protein
MRTTELIASLKNAANAGAEKALAACGNLPAAITKAAAYRQYGRANIDRWLQENLIDFTNKYFDRAKLAQVAAASNRVTYLPVAER